MIFMSDEFLFADDVEEDLPQTLGSWKVLIVDDEPEIHTVTKLAFSDFVFQDRNIEFISALSGADAKRLVKEHDDIAVVLLDVVMETDDAGLRVADFIRNDAQNYFTRIILRTGQPGQAPEREVIVNYDINDYKSKTELTAQKLFTVVISALRSYRDIINVELSRKGLEQVIESSTQLFNISSMDAFMDSLVQQMASMHDSQIEVAYLTTRIPKSKDLHDHIAYTRSADSGDMKVLPAIQALTDKASEISVEALKNQKLVLRDGVMVGFCNAHSFNGALLVLSGLPTALESNDQRLLEIFAKNVQAAFEKIQLAQTIESNQKNILQQAGKSLECRLSGGRHVQRVTLLCIRLGQIIGIPQSDLDVLSLAVRLHDIGSLVVPINLLTKSGDLTSDELNLIRRQIDEEVELLKEAQHPVLKTAALLAKEHNERWDGSGFPSKLAGEQIHEFTRVVDVVDMYDTLRGNCSESESLSKQQVVERLQSERGKQLDPEMVDVLLSNLDDFEVIISQNPDTA